MSRPRSVESAEKLDKYIDGFIQMCEDDCKIPSDFELSKYISVSPATLERFQRGGKEGETYHGYDEPFKKLKAYREHRLLRQLEASKGNNTAAIFQLKQVKNGGYTDNPIVTGEQAPTLKLIISGVGGEEAFK